jgi:hypothetical protein
MRTILTAVVRGLDIIKGFDAESIIRGFGTAMPPDVRLTGQTATPPDVRLTGQTATPPDVRLTGQTATPPDVRLGLRPAAKAYDSRMGCAHGSGCARESFGPEAEPWGLARNSINF